MTPQTQNPASQEYPASRKSDGEFFFGSDDDFRHLAISFLEQIGRILLNAALYGADHRLTIDAVRAAFPLQEKLSASGQTFTVDLVDDALMLNGRNCDLRNRLLQTVAERMRRQEISGFALLPGMTDDEFLNLLDLLLAPAPSEGGPDFAEELERRGLKHLQPRRGTWVQVPEGTVFKEEAEGGEEGEKEAGAAEQSELEAGGAAVEQIMAFLKGQVDADKVRQDIEEIAHKPEELAKLIMEAAAVRMKTAGLPEGESLADFVVGCLRRTFDELRKSRRARTQKGRRDLKKTLLMLEREVLDKLRQFAPDAGEDAGAILEQAVDEMRDSLDIEGLAVEYARRIKALEKSEKRLLRYIKKHPSAAAEAEGVPIPSDPTALKDWKPIAWTQAAGGDGGEGGALPEEVGVLAVLLTELDRLMRSGNPDMDAVKALNERIRDAAAQVAEETRRAIEEIPDSPPDDSAEAERIREERLREREMLSEIVQQLCQLAVSLNGALAMITYGLSHHLPLEHWEILTTATRCGRELNEMLRLLRSRVGLPSSLKPRRFWNSSLDA